MIIALLCALLLDYFFAEPKKYHPLVGFAKLATMLEKRLNEGHEEQYRINGFIAALIFLLPAWWLTDFIVADNLLGLLFEIIILYLALGFSNLKQQARNVIEALKNNQLDQARHDVTILMSRDSQSLESEDLSRAATEALLEKGNDVLFATIFWFLVAGAPGVVVYRLSNTMDAMWGSKTDRDKDFGFFIHKFDELLNYIPVRLTALGYALMGNWQNAMQCWYTQATFWESSNAGVILSAGAGALDVQLGGADLYHGELKERHELGCGKKADPDAIEQACQLLNRSIMLWIILLGLISLSLWF